MDMIRSLVVPPTCVTDSDFLLRRNLTQESLEAAYEEGEWMWIDVVNPSNEEIDWIGRFFNLSPSVMEDLYRVDRRPTLLVYPQYIFLSLFEPHIEKTRVEGKEIHCVIGERFLITVRAENTKAVDNAYDRAAKDPTSWKQGIAYFLYLTCQHAIDTYYPLLDRMSNQLNKMEEQIINEGMKNKTMRQTVYAIKTQLMNLRQMIAPQREVLSNILGEARLGEDAIRDLFRHLYERLLRVYDLIDAQRDLSSDVLGMMENQESRRMVDAVNRLTVFSMIFLPLTFFSSLFELNFVETPNPLILPITGSVMLILVVLAMAGSAGGMYFFLRRRGWI